MRVLITGGAGLVGSPVSRRIAELGWDGRIIGIDADCPPLGLPYAQCDIRDAAALARHVAGCDAIVHLAAIPSTRSHPNPEIFDVNVAGTYTVFEAAACAGVKRIIQASSINAVGGFWGCDDRRYDYFPLDEDLPCHTTDVYSFSKQMVEDIAEYYWRRAGISSVSFRLPAVLNDAIIAERQMPQSLMRRREQLEAFLRQPPRLREARLAAARERAQALRTRHIMEFDAVQRGDFEREAPPDDWLFAACFYDRFNFWTFIHTDDSTQAFEKALTADYEGAHPLFVNSDRNSLRFDIETLLRMFYPEVTKRVEALPGDRSPVSIKRARALLGFEPRVRSLL